jgi:hypothetical protein
MTIQLGAITMKLGLTNLASLTDVYGLGMDKNLRGFLCKFANQACIRTIFLNMNFSL